MKACLRLLLVLVLYGFHAEAAPDSAGPDSLGYARVVVAEAELRSGPGISYRVIYRAGRGETLVLATRSQTGFWLRVLLPDGREAYVLGDVVEPVAVETTDELPYRTGLFSPPRLDQAHAGFTLAAGVLGGSGYVELRPAFILAPALSLEPFFGAALQPDQRRFVYGGAVTLNLAPEWYIAPFVALGGGGVSEDPSDEFVKNSHSWFHARAGGGVLLSLRWRILVRLEAAHLIFFNEDEYEATQVYTGGIGTYF